MPSTSSVNIGNAGEHLLMAELLGRGHHAFMADRGNPAFDVAALLRDKRQVLIRCKTCNSNRTFQYNAKKNGQIFIEHEKDNRNSNDFVALIAPRRGQPFTARTVEIWILPTAQMESHLWDMHQEYFSARNRDGSIRKQQRNPWFTMRLDGDPTRSPLSGWAEKLGMWYENWDFRHVG